MSWNVIYLVIPFFISMEQDRETGKKNNMV